MASTTTALGHEAVQRGGQLRLRLRGSACARVEKLHRVPGLRRHLRDARAHDAGADHGHRRAFESVSPGLGCAQPAPRGGRENLGLPGVFL